MSSIKGLLLASVSIGVLSGLVSAEPYFAVRTGFKCSQCHVNSTGGGKRTDFGNIFSQMMLPKPLGEGKEVGFDPKLNDAVSIGSNWRVEQVHTMDYKANPSKDGLVIRESNVYVNIDLVKNFLSAYLDETMTPGATNREFFGKINLPFNSYFKAGNMLLPYGFRLIDDNAFVRDKTGYTYNTHDLGYEIGMEPGPVSLIANVTNTQLSTVGSVILPGFSFVNSYRIGGSFASGIKKADRGKNQNFGVFGGLSAGWITLLAQRDWIKRDPIKSIADYAEMDILPLPGMNFKFTFEHYWPNDAIPMAQNAQTRLGAGFEPFIYPYLQLGLYYRKNDWIPQNLGANQDEIIGRFHVFF